MSRGGITGLPLQRGAQNVLPVAPRSVQEWLASKRGNIPEFSQNNVSFPSTQSSMIGQGDLQATLFKPRVVVGGRGRPKNYVGASAVWGFDQGEPLPATGSREHHDALSTHMDRVHASRPRARVDVGAVWGFDATPGAAAQPSYHVPTPPTAHANYRLPTPPAADASGPRRESVPQLSRDRAFPETSYGLHAGGRPPLSRVENLPENLPEGVLMGSSARGILSSQGRGHLVKSVHRCMLAPRTPLRQTAAVVPGSHTISSSSSTSDDERRRGCGAADNLTITGLWRGG